MTEPAQQVSDISNALAAARTAYNAATRALDQAEAAALAAGIDTPTEDTVEELRVQRIRVVEPEGTTRMIIGNSATMNILPLRGEEVDHPGRRKTAGILFCNDEGTESGGMVYNGRTDDGTPQQSGYWTVDDYEQNEGFRFGASQTGDTRTKWIEFADQPHFSIADYLTATNGKTGDELRDVHQQFYPDPHLRNGAGLTRMRLSKEADGSVALSLRDANGTERIRMAVTADGNAAITATDPAGTTHHIHPNRERPDYATIPDPQDVTGRSEERAVDRRRGRPADGLGPTSSTRFGDVRSRHARNLEHDQLLSCHRSVHRASASAVSAIGWSHGVEASIGR